MRPVRVVVSGALGKMGRVVSAGILEAEDIVLAGALARRHSGEDLGQVLWGRPADVPIYDDLRRLVAETSPVLLCDFTTAAAAPGILDTALAAGLHVVSGTTGMDEAALISLAKACRRHGRGAAVIDNFSLGAHLLSMLSRQAARLFPQCEIIELHHAAKIDRPSGTALRLSQELAAAGGRSPKIHSVRLPGLVAHHRVLFGGETETLVLEHNSLSRRSFLPGLLAAIRAVPHRAGTLTRDLSDLLPAPIGPDADSSSQ